MRAAFFIICAAASLSVCAAMGCGREIVKNNCGAWRHRDTDGATCRECVGPEGRYAQCTMRVLEKSEGEQ